jgi:hypothetical protein
MYTVVEKKKVKAIPVQAWSGPVGSRNFRLSDFQTVDTVKVVKLSPIPTGLYPPIKIPGTHFC